MSSQFLKRKKSPAGDLGDLQYRYCKGCAALLLGTMTRGGANLLLVVPLLIADMASSAGPSPARIRCGKRNSGSLYSTRAPALAAASEPR
jgi:hypothetical protein